MNHYHFWNRLGHVTFNFISHFVIIVWYLVLAVLKLKLISLWLQWHGSSLTILQLNILNAVVLPPLYIKSSIPFHFWNIESNAWIVDIGTRCLCGMFEPTSEFLLFSLQCWRFSN
jgi:hypothetical protein